MIFNKLPLEGAYLIETKSFEDHRGTFARTYCSKEFAEADIDFKVLQSNISYSKHKDTIRGMHYQTGRYAEKKLVKCIKGRILDVIIDLRRDSKTFGKHYKTELNDQNNLLVLIPEGFAHGFLTLEPDCYVFYQVSNFYNKENEKAVRWNDPVFKIEWPVDNPVISEKDNNHPDFK